jgi:hypothetical protein
MLSEEDEKILEKEIKSWKGFEYALRKPNATLFNKMLKECIGIEEYAAAFKTKGPQYSTESLFMALIFQQQKIDNLKNLFTRLNSFASAYNSSSLSFLRI